MTFIGSLQGGSQGGSSGATGSLFGSTSGQGGISGLASGMNTDSMVTSLMQAAQIPLANLLRQREIDQWTIDSYRQVNNSLTDLQTSVSTMKLQSTFLAQNVTSTNAALVTGTVGAQAANGSFTVSVSQLAQGATVSSTSVLSTSTSYGDTTLASLLGPSVTTANLTINGENFSFTPATDSINTVLKAISGDPKTGVNAFYDASAGKVVLQTTATGSGTQINVSQDSANLFSNVFKLNAATAVASSTAIPSGGLTQGSGTVEINGVKFQFTATTGSPLTVAGIESTINLQSSVTHVTASDDGAGHLILKPSTGSTQYAPISVVDQSNILGFLSVQGTYRTAGTSVIPPGGLTSGGSVTINGMVISFNPGMTLTGSGGIEATINAQTAATGVKAFDDGAGHLLLSSNSPMTVSDSSNLIGLQNGVSSTVGQDAVYSINGFSSTSATNNPTYAGVTFHLQGVTGFMPVTLTTTSDVTSLVKSIQDFVNQYNTTLHTLQGLYSQQKYLNYQPLTSLQASQMTQQQIDAWNQKAESGMLSNDSLLGTAISTLQSTMSAIVGGQRSSVENGQTVTFNSLASIGIKPVDPLLGVSLGSTSNAAGVGSWSSYGQLQIDTTKLTQALQADSSAVMYLFTNNPSLTNPSMSVSDAQAQTGIAAQLAGDVSTTITQITAKVAVGSTNASAPASNGALPLAPFTWNAIDPDADLKAEFSGDSLNTSTLGNLISSIDKQALDMQLALSAQRQRYTTQFSQMEQALSRLNSQSSSFMSMLGQGSGTTTGG